MSTTQNTTIHASGREDLLAVPGVLLGFQPVESVAILCFEGSRVAFAARVDLADAEERASALVAQIAAAATQVDDPFFVLIAYGQDTDQCALALTRLSHPLTSLEFTIRETLMTNGTRYWSLNDDNEAVDHGPLDSSRITAEAVAQGVNMHKSREEVVREVETWEPLGIFDAELVKDGETASPEGVVEAMRDWIACQYTSITPEDALTLAVAFAQPETAAYVVDQFDQDLADQAWPYLVQARQTAPSGVVNDTLIVLGFAAWISGRGAALTSILQQIDYTAGNPLARILRLSHDLGVNPAKWVADNAAQREVK